MTAEFVDGFDRLPGRCAPVVTALQAAGIAPRVRLFAETAKTAQLAADLLGCPVGAIANSLIFESIHDDGRTAPLLIMTSGAHRVDTHKVAAELGRQRIRRADPEVVRAATGQVIGGVAPCGHPAPVETIIDVDLAAYDVLWAAAGTHDTVFALTYSELVGLTGGRELSVA